MASKSKKRRRVLGASCILAALIIAGSSFAWFTSRDEVTNRLSASSDYGVSIVESFAPPKNWIPGQEVDKDTYAVNTGSIPAYVRNDVSGVLSLTTEKPVEIKYGTGEEAGVAKKFVVYEDDDDNPTTPDVAVEKDFTTGTNFASFIKLDENEVFSIEAGSYLAYKPATSKHELGKQVVIYPSNAATTNTVYVCTAAGSYGGTTYPAGTTIDVATYNALNSTDKTKFAPKTYACITGGNAGGHTYAVGDTISAAEYNLLDSSDQPLFSVSEYDCSAAATVNQTDYTVGDSITADVYNTLSASDKQKFEATEVSTDQTVYVAKEAVTLNGNNYAAGKIVSADDYNNETSADKKAKVAVVTQSASKTDFTPDAEGLYVFRRTVVVNNNATEQFTYDGYYFKDGRYYKITDLEVTQDDSLDPNEKKEELDVAGDGNDKDGQLADAKAKFLVDDTTIYYQPKSFVYDADNNRLVATYLTDANGKYDAYKSAADALDAAEHTLAEKRTALDRALNDAAASDANVAFYANRMAQIQAEIDRVKARIKALHSDAPAAGTPDDGSIIDNLNDEVDRLSHATDPKGVIDKAKEAAQTKFDELYGTGVAVTFDEDGNNTTSYTKPTTADTAIDNSLWKAYLTAKEAVETARQSGNYGHDLFTAYVNELTKDSVYGSVFTTAGFTDLTKVTYEDVLNTLSYAQLTNTSKVNFDDIEQNAGGPLHNINRLTANLVKAKDDYDKKLAEYNSQVTSVKTNTQRLGKEGTKTTTAAPAAGCNEEIVGGTTIKYNKVTVSGESGVKGDLARANAELDTLKSKLTALNTAYDTAAEAAANAERVDPNDSNSADTSETATAAWTAYQAASAAYDEALNKFNAAKKAYENGNPLKIYINLSENVVTKAAGLADRWQLLPVDPLSDGFTADGRVVGEDGVAGDSIADTAVFYYTSILGAGETSTKLIDSVTLDAGTTQGMYKAFDYDLNVALKSAQIAYTGADNATISTDPANTEFGARYVDGLNNTTGTIKGAKATLTNDKSLDTAVNWAEDDTVD